ncbi:MAG: MarR family winged helix-turn-helix transcriptional regulator [Dehalococcoidia bacterium]
MHRDHPTDAHPTDAHPTDAHPTDAQLADASFRLKDALVRFLALVEPLRLDLWERRGLTLPQLRLLFAVRDAAGAATGEVGQAIGLGGSSLTGLVDRVAALGFVRREADPQDRRVTRLSLTEAGATVLAEVESQREPDFAAVLAQLAPDRQLLLADLFEEFMAAAQRLVPDPGAEDASWRSATDAGDR